MIGVPKNPPIRDDAFREWIRAQPCHLGDRDPCECGGYQRVSNRHLATECSHIKSRGAGGGDPANIVPQCGTHHKELHRIGRKTFERRYGVALAVEADDYWERYQAETAWSR